MLAWKRGLLVGWLNELGIVENKPRLSSVPSVADLHQAAEKQVVRDEQAASNVPVENLVQELRVHQVELEMQNEELRRAQLALEESLNRYISLYEFSPVGYLTLTENGTIVEANLVSADLLGENRSNLIKQRFSRFIVPEDSDHWHQHFYYVLQHGKCKSCEVRVRRVNGTFFYAKLDCLLLGLDILALANLDTVAQKTNQKNSPKINSKASTEILPVTDSNGLMMRVVLTDITELKLAEQELRVAATVFESQEGMMVTDAKNMILKVNNAFTNITGYTADEVVGKTPRLLSSGHHDDEFYKTMWQGCVVQTHGKVKFGIGEKTVRYFRNGSRLPPLKTKIAQ